MQIGAININAAWVASKTLEEITAYFMRKWGGGTPHPSFRKLDEGKRKEYIQKIWEAARTDQGVVSPAQKQNNKTEGGAK